MQLAHLSGSFQKHLLSLTSTDQYPEVQIWSQGQSCILTWYPWKKLSISFIPVLYGKPCIRTKAPGWGRIGVWVAVAAAATAPGGAARYPTVVGDTGGLKEREGAKLLQKTITSSTTQNRQRWNWKFRSENNPNTTEKQIVDCFVELISL